MLIEKHPAAEELEARRAELIEAAVRDGDRRFRADLGLVYYEDERPTHRGGHVAQESLGYAAALLALGRDPERARAILQAVLRHQSLERADRHRGGFFWFAGQDRVIDHNAVSFVVPWVGWLLRHHAAALGGALCESAREALRRALDALLAHPSGWAYTNIHLLNTAALFAVAECGDDSRARDIAGEWWREWVDGTQCYGVTEYLSPTYTAVQIEALELMLDSAAVRGGLRTQVETVLDRYWSDLLLAFHAGSGRFAGTFSRGKPADYLRSKTGLNLLARLHLGAPSADLGCYNATPALAARAISAAARDRLAHPLPRSLRDRLPMHGIERACYLETDWAVASQSGAYARETSVIALWRGGGFFHQAPHPRHRNHARQSNGCLLFVEDWRGPGRGEDVESEWVLFDAEGGGGAPRVRRSDTEHLLVEATRPCGRLAVQFLAPGGWSLDADQEKWIFRAHITGESASPIAVWLRVANGHNAGVAEVPLCWEETLDAEWRFQAGDLEIRAGAAPGLLQEGSGRAVQAGAFFTFPGEAAGTP